MHSHSKRPIRVLHVIDSLGVGGTENLLLRLLRHLPGVAGVVSRVCVLCGCDQLVTPGGLGTDAVGLAYSGDYRNIDETLRVARRLSSVARQHRAHVVHSYLWLSDVISGIAIGRYPTRHLCHVVDRRRVQTSDRVLDKGRRALTRLVLKRSNARFVAVSEAAREFATNGFGWRESHIRVAHNGIDVAEFGRAESMSGSVQQEDPVSGAPLVVGMLGRMVEEKGHSYLLRAVSTLVHRGHDVVLRIAGTGPLQSELAALALREGIRDRTAFLGQVPDAAAFYRSVDVFAQPSIHSEGLPTTILEAMASETAVLATDVGGAREAVEHGVCGILVAPESEDALARALVDLASDSRRRRALGKTARERVAASFTARGMATEVARAYEDLMRGW